MKRFSGKGFSFTMGDVQVNVKNVSLSIEDGEEAAMSNGIPDGWVEGEVKANGDIEVDVENFKLLSEGAARAGSWKNVPALDFQFFANVGTTEFLVEAYGCRLKISDLINVDPASTDRSVVKINYNVTSPDFVSIDGVPYLSQDNVNRLSGVPR